MSLLFIIVFVVSCKNAYIEKAVVKNTKSIKAIVIEDDIQEAQSNLHVLKCEYINKKGKHVRDLLIHDISGAEIYVHEFYDLEKEGGPTQTGLASKDFITPGYTLTTLSYEQREDYGPFVSIEKVRSSNIIEVKYYAETEEFEIVRVNSKTNKQKIIGKFINCERGYEFDNAGNK